MAKPLDLTGIEGLEDPSLCTIEASVVTGFETVAQEEFTAKFGKTATWNRGRVIGDVPIDRVKEVLDLRCVDNVWVMMGHTHSHPYPESPEDQMQSLADFCIKLDWTKALDVWRKVVDFEGNLYPEDDQRPGKISNGSEPGEEPAKKARTEIAPTFRCTVYRSGTNHNYSSPAAQVKVGGAIQDKFHWDVKMKQYDIEVTLNCDVDQVYAGIALTYKSLHLGRLKGLGRTITHFGPTTLRPTICAGLVRLAKIQPGDIVLDPMCGGGSIPLEGEHMDNGLFLGGELHDMAIGRCRDNLADLTKSGEKLGRVDFVHWNVLQVPMRDNSVDVVVTDLPFGKRSGSKADNRTLYPATLLSLARVVRPMTGRAVLLTQDRNSMFKSLGKVSKYWKTTKHIQANIGGLVALVFLLARTDATVNGQEKSKEKL